MSGSLGASAPAAAPEEGNGKAVQEKRGEIYTYEAENPSYAMNWSVSSMPHTSAPFRAVRCHPQL